VILSPADGWQIFFSPDTFAPQRAKVFGKTWNNKTNLSAFCGKWREKV
jgi:hypothetical protein